MTSENEFPWSQASVADVIVQKRGSQIRKLPTSEYFQSGKLPIIDQGADIICGYTDNVGAAYPYDLPVIVFGDHTRVLKYIDFPFVVGADGTQCLQPSKQLNPRFFYYALTAINLQSEGYARHFKLLKEKHISFPGIDEQQRIAEVLRSVDDTIAASVAVTDRTNSLLNAFLSDTFSEKDGTGTERCMFPIEDMLDRIIDYRGVAPPKSDKGVPLITARNVRFGYLVEEPREFIAEEAYDSWMRRGIPMAGDILFTTEAPLGFVAEFPPYKAALGQRTITLVPKLDRLDRKYLKWLLLSPPAQATIHRHATGSTAKGIKQSTFRKLQFKFHSLEKQIEIGTYCSSLAEAVTRSRESVSQLRRVKARLLKDLLSGGVRVPK
ncbi:restriction endonuclease subunit S [Methylobacterium soli]|uniref:Type I restriction modification DNA specificity domain-containing protein n=1 Tax=Methylobacterium soli TaxID=553447 RepID=A0A6L3SUW6_9HYPH|nr:restriction endonuclease subunit S [Methylobacterium soli]KAB1077443.1 hypothetical protein F6X53_19205 [Methylobacterium soli]GJE45890.1 hypothetical protein AEGHOMDF_5090 [Methylobacterium soli]